MYDEARFVAAMDSDEEELKAERAEIVQKFNLKNSNEQLHKAYVI